MHWFTDEACTPTIRVNCCISLSIRKAQDWDGSQSRLDVKHSGGSECLSTLQLRSDGLGASKCSPSWLQAGCHCLLLYR